MARSSSRDPLEKFRFLVEWSFGIPGTSGDEATPSPRAGFRDIQSPKRNTSEIMYREGNDPDIYMKSPGLSTFEDVTLSRGLVKLDSDENNELYKWMSAVHKPIAGHPGVDGEREPNAAAGSYRKDVTITMLDRTGTAARKWKLYNAWPKAFVAGSDLDAGEDGDKSIEQLTLGFEDFQELDPASVSDTPVEDSASLTDDV